VYKLNAQRENGDGKTVVNVNANTFNVYCVTVNKVDMSGV